MCRILAIEVIANNQTIVVSDRKCNFHIPHTMHKRGPGFVPVCAASTDNGAALFKVCGLLAHEQFDVVLDTADACYTEGVYKHLDHIGREEHR